jgi:hypothetical protein
LASRARPPRLRSQPPCGRQRPRGHLVPPCACSSSAVLSDHSADGTTEEGPDEPPRTAHSHQRHPPDWEDQRPPEDLLQEACFRRYRTARRVASEVRSVRRGHPRRRRGSPARPSVAARERRGLLHVEQGHLQRVPRAQPPGYPRHSTWIRLRVVRVLCRLLPSRAQAMVPTNPS